MGTIQGIIVIVYRKRGRVPVWRCGMAGCAIRWKGQCGMIRIGRLVVIHLMAGITIGRCALIPIGVAVEAIDRGMRAGQREVSLIMHKHPLCTTGRMTSQA